MEYVVPQTEQYLSFLLRVWIVAARGNVGKGDCTKEYRDTV